MGAMLNGGFMPDRLDPDSSPLTGSVWGGVSKGQFRGSQNNQIARGTLGRDGVLPRLPLCCSHVSGRGIDGSDASGFLQG